MGGGCVGRWALMSDFKMTTLFYICKCTECRCPDPGSRGRRSLCKKGPVMPCACSSQLQTNRAQVSLSDKTSGTSLNMYLRKGQMLLVRDYPSACSDTMVEWISTLQPMEKIRLEHRKCEREGSAERSCYGLTKTSIPCLPVLLWARAEGLGMKE